jgi:hypothetical protein
MNLRAEKLDVVRMVLDTDDKKILGEVKAIFKKHQGPRTKEANLQEFYDGFRDGIREVKASMNGEIELKDARTWLNELQG